MDTIALLDGKRIILGVCGSIASYKSVDLASKLTQSGVAVDVIMTEAAQRFVAALSFQAVSGRPVYTDLWQSDADGGLPTHIAHVGLAEDADMLLIAPATANTIAKLAHGLADDLLTVTALAAKCPLAIAPAMDGAMYENPALRANLEVLRARDVHLIEPETGRFASGLSGLGRLPETSTLIGQVRRILGLHGELAGHKLVVTAGGTREALDPVRFLSNRSSGKQGYAIAQASLDAGAEVVLISAAQHLAPPIGAKLVSVDSAAAMKAAVLENLVESTALIMAAAVADFRPAAPAGVKLKRRDGVPAITLEPTPDILASLGSSKPGGQILVGFAAETESLVENARQKLHRKNLDLVVANDVTQEGSGFDVDTNAVTLLDRDGTVTPLPVMSKDAVADRICDWLLQHREHSHRRGA